MCQCLDSHCTQTFIFNERKAPLTKPSLIGVGDCRAALVRHSYSTEAVIHCFQTDGCTEVNKRPKVCLTGGIERAVENNIEKHSTVDNRKFLTIVLLIDIQLMTD